MARDRSIQSQVSAATAAGAYSHLSGLANGRMTYDEAVDYLLQLYGQMGTFTRPAAEQVVSNYQAGLLGTEFNVNTDFLGGVLPPAVGAVAYGQSGSYQYDVSVEFTCYGQTENVFVRVVADSVLTGEEVYGQALDAAFERITSKAYGGAAAEEECEPTGNFTLHAIYALQ